LPPLYNGILGGGGEGVSKGRVRRVKGESLIKKIF